MRKSSILLGCVLAAGLSSSALAQDFSYKGSITSDLHMTVPGTDRPSDVDPVRFDRMDNTFKFTGNFTYENVSATADISLTYTGKSDVYELETLRRRTKVDPIEFESEALFVLFSDFIVEGLDLRVGRQIIDWGTADRFNPTNPINSLDLEDYQDFGRRVANEMINLTFAPDWEIEGEETPFFSEFQFQVVWVPRFRSGLIPESSEYVFGGPDQFRRFAKTKVLNDLVDLQQLFVDYGGSILYDVKVSEPSDSIENSQVGVRMGFSVMGVDIDFYGYYGFDHNMQPSYVSANAVSTDEGVSSAIKSNIYKVFGSDADRNALTKLLKSFGKDGISTVTAYTDVIVNYPRVGMFGMDFSSSLDFLGGLGFWGELAFFFPDAVELDLTVNEKGPEKKDKLVKDDMFVKAVLGFDNSFTKWFYLNMQYIYGFVDEFGSGDLEHYLMVNLDFKALNEQMLIRISSVICLTDPSAMLVPHLSWKLWSNTEFILGGLFHLGDDDSTFGNRITGPNYIYLQAKYSF